MDAATHSTVLTHPFERQGPVCPQFRRELRSEGELPSAFPGHALRPSKVGAQHHMKCPAVAPLCERSSILVTASQC
eukprot:91968-Pyramimonas_sp.AAC.1